MAGAMEVGTLLLWSFLAALAAGVGAALGTRPWVAERGVGWASAVAAGLMLGTGYVLLTTGQSIAPAATLLGAAIGLVIMRMLDGVPLTAPGAPTTAISARVSAPPAHDAGAILASALHSAAEGVAIGAAAAVGASIAQFLLLTLAIHNISEGAVLGIRLRRNGGRTLIVAGVAVIARSSQPLCAVSMLLLAAAAPWLLPWCIGASFGALLYLIVAELLPQSYREVGRTGIAVVVSLAAGMVALMGVAP
jgi:ZIP family zinc transporter